MYILEGVSSVANFITAYVVSIKLRLIFLSVMCSLFPKAIFIDIYFATLQLVLVPCGGGRTSLRTLP